MGWQEVKGAFLQDSSFRDIFVLGSKLDDWPNVLQVLKAAEYGIVQSLPADIEKAIEENYELGCLLRVDLGGPVLNCHFFPEEEIEFDLDPRELLSIDAAERVFLFMSRLGRALRSAAANQSLTVPAAGPNAHAVRRVP